MLISELAERTGVPVHTLKFYLRERVLPPGRTTSRTRAEYDDGHVDRVRLVRALVEHGGVGIAGVRSIVQALDAPPPSRHELLGVAHQALPPPAPAGEVSELVDALLDDLGWPVWREGPLVGALSRAVATARDCGVTLDAPTLRRYAEAMRASRRSISTSRAVRAPPPRPSGSSCSAPSSSTPSCSPCDGSPRRRPAPGGPEPEDGHDEGPVRADRAFDRCSPDGIRTRATALRGRRARPLHNGAVVVVRAVGTGRATGENLTEREGLLRNRDRPEAGSDGWGTRTRT